MQQSSAAPVLGSRALFPRLETRAYLSHAAISPVSEPVRQRVAALVDDYAQHGVAAFGHWMQDRELVRERLARLIGTVGSNLAFVANTTHGVLQVAQCLDWRRGDVMMLLDGEFPANVAPWLRAAEDYGLEVRWLGADSFRTNSAAALEHLEAELARGVRLLAVSAVQFQTGHRMPLDVIGQLCRHHETLLFVDGIQAVGAVPLDVGAGIDFLSCGSHKWLMGLEGAGFLFVAPERASLLVPRTLGWLSHEEGERFLFDGPGHLRYDRKVRPAPRFIEGATVNAVGLAALGAAVELIESLGMEPISGHIQRYIDALERELKARGFTSLRSPEASGRSGILSTVPPGGIARAGAWQKALAARGVACSLPDGYLRFAPHWPNALDEVSLIVEAIDAAGPSLTG